MLAVLIWVAWPASVYWVPALAVGTSLVFRGIHWLKLGAVNAKRMGGESRPVLETAAAGRIGLTGNL